MNKHSLYVETYARRRYLRYVLPIENPDNLELECVVSVSAPSIYPDEIHYLATRKSRYMYPCARARAKPRFHQ